MSVLRKLHCNIWPSGQGPQRADFTSLEIKNKWLGWAQSSHSNKVLQRLSVQRVYQSWIENPEYWSLSFSISSISLLTFLSYMHTPYFSAPTCLLRHKIHNPDSTIRPEPITMESVSCSPKTVMPKAIPNISRVYRNGVTADTSPVRMAVIKHQ